MLRDIIASGKVPVVRLSTVFRQATQSLIITNAHRINEGEIPSLKNDRDGDFFFLAEDEPIDVAETIVDLVKRRLPEGYGLNAFTDIQILAPMYRGETGANNLNSVLQQMLNPKGDELERNALRLRVGDKVMQVRNNYDKDVFNGDIGRVRGIDTVNQTVAVAYPDRTVAYDYADLDEIVLAYAVSVHKSQGSEYRAVVLPLTTQHYVMLQRNLLYTAVTRARDFVVIVGSRKALRIAVRNNRVGERHTSLVERLRSGTDEGAAC